MTIHLRRDLILLAACAATVLVLVAFGSNLSIGRAARMGPGYFPLLIAIGIGILGAAILLRSLRRRASEKGAEVSGEPISWRAVGSIVASMGAFALLVRPLGFVPASLATVLACTAAQADYSGWGERLLLAGGLAAFASVVFVTGLGLPFALLSGF